MRSKGSIRIVWQCLLHQDEGFTIPEHYQYYSSTATCDFELMFNPNTGLENSEKLPWDPKHIPLTLSVCSNVPYYD